MTTTINASTSTGLVSTADTSGIIKLQSNGKTTNAVAWVNFNGVSGSVAIRSSYNVSSITYNGAGDYTLNYTTALADTNYALGTCAKYPSVAGDSPTAIRYVGISSGGVLSAVMTTSLTRIVSGYVNGTLQDADVVTVLVFGN